MKTTNMLSAALKNMICCTVLLFFAEQAYAQALSRQIVVQSDNDSYLLNKLDRYYTNGFFVQIRQANPIKDSSRKLLKRISDIEFGQQIFNPYGGVVPDPQFADRPYAGYLYGALSMQYFYTKESGFKAQLQGGVVGPSAGGQKVQNFIHHAFNFYEVDGWQNQIRDEFGVNLQANYFKLISRFANERVDWTGKGEIKAGTTFSQAKLGILVRLGHLNKLFESASMQSNIALHETPRTEFYLYAQPSLTYVAYNATISGGMFREDKGVITFHTKPFYPAYQWGIVYAKKHWTADLSVTFKGKEVESTALGEQFGSIKLGYSFN